MMCPFFHQQDRSREPQQLRADGRRLVRVIVAPWCTHKHTPVRKDAATSVSGGHKLLQCHGLMQECPLPADLLDDIA